MPRTLGVVSSSPEVALEFVRRLVRHSRTHHSGQPPHLLMSIHPVAGELTQAAAALRRAGAAQLAVLDDGSLAEAEAAAARADLALLDGVAATVAATARAVGGRGAALLLAGPEAGLATRYQVEASRQGLAVLLPEPQARERLGQAIQQVRQGQLAQARPLALETALAEVRRVCAQGPAAAIVLASPALAVVLRPEDFTEPTVDCLDELARSAARFAQA